MRVRNLFPVLESSRFFDPLRNIYLRSLKPGYWRENILSRRRFYSRFVGKGSVVFDVGANWGECTKSFLFLGAAKVVAVEPIPDLARRLQAIPDSRLKVVPCAIDNCHRMVQFNICNFDSLSSISNQWVDKVAENKEARWISRVEVEAVTLDSLIAQHGMPDFIKLDIEGNELAALQGLSVAPKYMSFEFHADTIREAIKCLHQPCFSERTRFNYIVGEPAGPNSLALDHWIDATEMQCIAETTLSAGRIYGDLLARSD